MKRRVPAAPADSRTLYLNSLAWFMGLRPTAPAKPAKPAAARKRK